jgi:hypothetical protein
MKFMATPKLGLVRPGGSSRITSCGGELGNVVIIQKRQGGDG